MTIKINGKEYNLELKNLFGPMYEFQRMTGDVPTGNNLVEIAYGALALYNRGDVLPTFEQFLSETDDATLMKCVNYISERIVAINADKEPVKVEDSQGEA